VKEVRCSHLVQAFVGELTGERRLRLRHGRFEQTAIAQARGAAISFELSGVQFEDVVDIEELGLVSAHFASLRIVES